jgi:hypothetical protein
MRGRSAATLTGGARKVGNPPGDQGKKSGWVMEKERPLPYGDLANGATCGCAVCPCRGDDDIDTISNGGWYWPIETRKLPEEELSSSSSSSVPPKKEEHKYEVEVEHVPKAKKPVVPPKPEIKVVTKTVVKTRYVPVPEKSVVEKTVYVPVYDDPFWNPRRDGRLAGEGIGAPMLNPRGAASYKQGAWFER